MRFDSWLSSGLRARCVQGRLAAWCVLGGTLLAVPAWGHEFWLVPVTAPLAVGDTARIGVKVGEFFEGDSLGFSAPQAAALHLHTANGSQDLLPALARRGAVAELALPLTVPGTTLLSYATQPNTVTLSADRFHAYLHDEGLDFIAKKREAAGTAEKPGRERYRRFVKTLIKVRPSAGASETAPADTTYNRVVGQRLEVVPLNDPLALQPGGALGIHVLFEGKPLPGALVKAWHKTKAEKGEGQLLTVRSVTSPDGKVFLNLPYAGAWMVSVVHMVPAVGVKDIDWESQWANLSFSVEPAATRGVR